MRLRHLVPALSLLALATLGMQCSTKRGLVVVAPAPGSVVDTFSFTVEIFAEKKNLDPSGIAVTLNGEPLAVVEGPPGTFSAVVDPGDPLRDENLLEVEVPKAHGNGVKKAKSPFRYLPPKARAVQIGHASQLLQGPLAHNRIGDYLLENSEARFVVQAPGQRDLHSVGQFGGNLIDAELVSRPGRDSFFEFQPSVNIETVLNVQTVEIVNDGQNGLPAVVRACGPDDLIDYINASSQISSLGLNLPNVMALIDDRDYDVEGCTEYALAPLKRYVSVETEITNNSIDDEAFYVGDYVNGMGTLEQWTRNGAPKYGLGEALVSPFTNLLAYFGFDRAEGVDYGIIPITFPGGFPSGSSSFTTSGVSFLLHSHFVIFVLGFESPPLFEVPAGGSNSFLRYFAVGDGSLANSLEVEAEVKGLAMGTLRGCVTVGGAPAPSARVAVGLISAGKIANVDSHFVTGDNGCYGGKVLASAYGVAAAVQGAPYEGGGINPVVHPVVIPAGGEVVQDIALPATGRVHVTVVDETGSPLPARISVVGADPSPEPLFGVPIPGLGTVVTGLFNDPTRDVLSRGMTALAYAGADGMAEFDLEPGAYQIAVSRGTEYSIHKEEITSVAGATLNVDAQLGRVVDTTGFISSDYHVHMLNSPDSRIALETRAISFAAEGVDNLIATDHDAVTDMTPTIASLGLAPFLHSTPGEEITTFDYGHFNAYPQGVDPSLPSGGATDWAGPAPPGEDFPAYGHYSRTPAQVEAEALGKPQNAGLGTVVQINHIGSHFNPLEIDTSVEPPQSFLADPTIFRLDPSVANFFHPFVALELWNGSDNGAQSAFLDARMGIWMNLLSQGLLATAIADTDTHTVRDLETAGARTWTPSSNDHPPAIADAEIGLAVMARKAVGGQGVFVTTRLMKGAAEAGFGLGDDTLVTAADGSLDLQIEIQAPLWAPYDTIEIYRNAQTVQTGDTNGTPTDFSATPDDVLTLGAADFVRSEVDVFPAVPGGERFETSKTVSLAGLGEDTWVVVVVKGTVGSSVPLFPVFPRNADAGQSLAQLIALDPSEGGVRALGFTNALFVDVDGNGAFDPPGVNVAP